MRNGFVLALTLVVVSLGVQAAHSSPVPGSGDPFIFNFDENGNASYQVWDPTLNGGSGGYNLAVNDPGQMLADLGGSGGSYLTFALPQPVYPGDVAIVEEDGKTIGDGLRFGGPVVDNNGDVQEMQFYSTDTWEGLKADTGFPTTWPSTNYEVGPTENANETFQFVAGDGEPSDTNFYNGISGVPEPSRLIGLLGCAGMGLIGLIWRRRQA